MGLPTVIMGDACGLTMPATRCATPIARPPAIKPIAAPTHAVSTRLTEGSDPEPSARRVAPSPRRSLMDGGGSLGHADHQHALETLRISYVVKRFFSDRVPCPPHGTIERRRHRPQTRKGSRNGKRDVSGS